MLTCPNCHRRNIGKIANNQYYCWDCFIELAVEGDRLTTYQVEEDGSLSSLDDLFTEDELRIQESL
ncbi:hypothetical protein TEPIDINF_000445 [Tepidibacillus infernus]|uniref:Zn-ribbon containing protein n=1 Tax=Tepidibacillus decaturensis TaxID=1413211 RepID=A0A135L294_9BACI|nr:MULTISPECIES: hypothetical protein [Tepidibacillus]KXG43128.1 hypothetical protein U473_03130 [Tepidibacillus decaturensis]GBF10075.1 hypothetical protein HK1_00087 [Tepidibacillus sp. HK-1]